jgi:hypothetical protein
MTVVSPPEVNQLLQTWVRGDCLAFTCLPADHFSFAYDP